jgi:2-keto-4-pentenoate hydratase/2-oxohepta-3-ene-1,7-dioic acid hydratase in catechol pathway
VKFASYLVSGKPTFGILVGDGLVTLGGRIPGIATLRAAIEADRLEELGRLALGERPDRRPSEVTFLPVIPNPSKTLCIGLNYSDHASEGGNKAKPQPGYFIKVDDSLVGHGQPLEMPAISEEFDFEGELAVIIGKTARNIAEKDALSCVAGYTCFMDGSVRDFQRRSVCVGKNFQATGASGPYMVTADEIPDPARLTLSTYLNGERVQHAGTDTMIHSVPKSLAYMSSVGILRPGDVIATGTPSGVGHARKPPLWMKPGDRIEVEISGIGRLSNAVEAPR